MPSQSEHQYFTDPNSQYYQYYQKQQQLGGKPKGLDVAQSLQWLPSQPEYSICPKCVRPMERLYHKHDGSIGRDKRTMKLYKDGVDCDECKRCKIDTDYEN